MPTWTRKIQRKIILNFSLEKTFIRDRKGFKSIREITRLLFTGSDSGKTKNPNKKFTPARNADIKNGALGEISPKRPPIRGPKINPIPNAAPISPKFFALSFSEDMSVFERYLTIWVGLCILVGVALGKLFPGIFLLLSELEYASVNLLIALLIWAMIYPMMVSVDLKSLHRVAEQPKGLIITLVVNWFLKPFSMAALGVFFFRWLFADLIPEKDAESYIAGLILLGAAPCTAMVFVWSHLTNGDPNYTLVQVSLNDVIMVFAFAPIVAFLLGVTDIPVPWETLLLSVGLYVVVPLMAGVFTRHYLTNQLNGDMRLAQFNTLIKPYSIVALLGTIVLLFGFQGEVILDQPVLILLIAIPLLIQSYGIFAIAYFSAWRLKVPFKVAAPCAMIGTSNFFELAVAVAISLFGLNSGAALATVVGVLVEVPVMLSLVAFANRTKNAFEHS